jgi:hypothetical protein
MRRKPPVEVTLKRLRKERAHYLRILGLQTTSFTYRQRLRKAIAARDTAIAVLESTASRAKLPPT